MSLFPWRQDRKDMLASGGYSEKSKGLRTTAPRCLALSLTNPLAR